MAENKLICCECHQPIPEGDADFCQWCGRPVCPACAAEHEETCPEAPGDDEEGL